MIIWDEVVEVVREFSSRSILEAWKRTFITLLPKRHDALESSHFISISLCTTLYKVCAKILVGRMKPILSRLICLEKGAFIGGRIIYDNVIIIQEFMHDLQRAQPIIVSWS